MNIVEHLNLADLKHADGWELDAGFALAMGLRMQIDVAGVDPMVEVFRSDRWQPFSPTTSWEDFGFAISQFQIVIGTHGGEDGDRHWHSAHAFLSGTSFEAFGDLRVVAARAATAYGRVLDWHMANAESADQPAPPVNQLGAKRL